MRPDVPDNEQGIALGVTPDELCDDELVNLFAAFDEVGASDELKDATMARIGVSGEAAPAGEAAVGQASADSGKPEVKALAGGKHAKRTRKAKWRAIRVAAVAACLTLALSGGVAYAVPVSYYDVQQDGSTLTLGVNAFGFTVSATSEGEVGDRLVSSTELCNMPYEESLSRAIGAMEELNPEAPIEYGPKGGERVTVEPQGSMSDGGSPEGAGLGAGSQGADDAANGAGETAQPGGGAPQLGDDGAETPQGQSAPDNPSQDEGEGEGADRVQGL